MQTLATPNPNFWGDPRDIVFLNHNRAQRTIIEAACKAFPWVNPDFDIRVRVVDKDFISALEIHLREERLSIRELPMELSADFLFEKRIPLVLEPDWHIDIPLAPTELDVFGAFGAAVLEIKKRNWASDGVFRRRVIDKLEPVAVLHKVMEPPEIQIAIGRTIVESPSGKAILKRTAKKTRWFHLKGGQRAPGSIQGKMWSVKEVLDGVMERENTGP